MCKQKICLFLAPT